MDLHGDSQISLMTEELKSPLDVVSTTFSFFSSLRLQLSGWIRSVGVKVHGASAELAREKNVHGGRDSTKLQQYRHGDSTQ